MGQTSNEHNNLNRSEIDWEIKEIFSESALTSFLEEISVPNLIDHLGEYDSNF